MKKHKASQVFVPGGMPQYTYIGREEDLEGRVKSADDNLCKLVTLTGSTKSGKTVLANKIFPNDTGDNIWIDGGTVSREDDIWSFILENVNGYTDVQRASSNSSTTSLKGGVESQLQIPFLASAKGKIEPGLDINRSSAINLSRSLPSKVAAIRSLKESEKPLIIDDFHYLDRDLQGSIIRALKPLVFGGHPIIIIAIPHRRYDAVKVEREMTGRLESIVVPTWDSEELIKIPETGFPLLNVALSENLLTRLADEAYGSPHLMQDFCRNICYENQIVQTLDSKLTIADVSDQLFKNLAEGTGRVIFDKLVKGPRQRSDRMARRLAGGGTADIYRVVLMAMARLSPGMASVEYESLRAAIRDALQSDIPQAHEVSRVLEKMADIASTDESSTPVIDWEKDERRLHITDPFFAFFLKWGAHSKAH